MLKMINYWTATEPSVFGFYHIICILLVIVLSVFLIIKVNKPSEKTLNRILLISAITMLLFEVYKELTYMTNYDETTQTYDYEWYSFPFQFCSTTMYIMLIAGLLKPGKFKDAMLAFLATYSLFGGLTVYAYPEQVFVERVGINIQTMVHHGLQVIIGCYLLGSGVVKFHYKTLIKGTYVFIGLFIIALVMNIVVYNTGIANGETFNMFFIGPYYECTLPLVSLFYPKEFTILKYLLFLCIYIFGFIAASGAVLGLGFGLKKLIIIIQSKLQKNNNVNN